MPTKFYIARARLHLLAALSVFSVFSVCLPVHANQCISIQCDCATLDVSADRQACEAQQASLENDCKATGNLTGYCQVAGLDARPLPFSLYDLPASYDTEESIESALRLLESLYWSVSEDQKSAQNYQAKSAYGNALTTYKNLSAGLDRIFGIQRQAYNSWRQLDEKGYAEDVVDDGYEPLHGWAETLYSKARGLWGDRPESDPKLQSRRQVLAMNVLRYAGSTYQQAAELAALAKEYEVAAQYWEAAASTSELMISWREQTNAKAQYINYYRQQGVASWFRAALYWDRDENEELALEARNKANLLQQTKLAGVN